MTNGSSTSLLNHFDRIAEAPDAVPRLRRFILDLAVRGKLVPQDPNDEPASELLKRIKAEKVRLANAGKAKTRQISPSDDRAMLSFDVPKHWACLPLNAIGTLSGGMTPSKNRLDYWDGEVNWFSPKDIKSEELIVSGMKITPAGVSETGLQLYRPGCLFMVARSGILKRTFPVSINRVAATVNQDLKVLAPFIKGMERYLQIALKGMTDFILGNHVKTGTTVQSLKFEGFEYLPLPLPPNEEQHRIVAKVDELMALCDQLEAAQTKRERRRDRLVAATLHGLNDGAAISVVDEAGNVAGGGEIPASDVCSNFENNARFLFNHLPNLITRPEQIKQLRQTILNLAVRGKLVPQDPNDEPASVLLKRIEVEKKNLIKAGEIRKGGDLPQIGDADISLRPPSSWEWVRLGSIGDWGSGSTPPRGNSEYYDGGIPWLKSGELEDRTDLKGSEETVSEIAISKCSFRKNKPGDVLIAMYGATIGKLAILGESAVTNQAVCGCTPFDGVYNRYLFLYLLSRRSNFHAQSEGGAQPNISKIKIINSPFPLPPLAEQHRIVVKVDELMALCDELEVRITSSSTTRYQLLDAALAEVLA
ncbi:MAG TPA: restriction endonuclease subunit S [Candidatus Deferrimicrobiaceae bacterium]|jgi:type I restriction enzyme S subunit